MATRNYPTFLKHKIEIPDSLLAANPERNFLARNFGLFSQKDLREIVRTVLFDRNANRRFFPIGVHQVREMGR